MQLASVSTQYVRIPVQAVVLGAAYNPTADSVAVAFTTAGTDPASTDFHVAAWETVTSAYYAVILVGPAGLLTLAVGTYTVWVKVTDNPEVPVIACGTLTIT